MAEVVSAIKSIFGIIKAVSTIRELLGGTARDVITTVVLERVVRGENARFFTTIAFADIETIHNQFYRVWLPSVTDQDEIKADAINLPTGALYHIFRHLLESKVELARLMNRLREVFRSYSSSLDVDELVGGVLAFMHGFGLLFHIHGVYAELRRIQINAASLDDRRLLADTLAALQYLTDGEAALNLLLQDSTIENIRVGSISAVRSSGGTNLNPPRFSFSDSYKPLSSTPSDHDLFVPLPRNPNSASKPFTERLREEHVTNVRNRMGVVFISPANEVQAEYAKLRTVLNERVSRQSITPPLRTGAVLKPGESESEEGSDAQATSETEAEGHHEDFLAVPADADEFIALSDKLRTEGFVEREGLE